MSETKPTSGSRFPRIARAFAFAALAVAILGPLVNQVGAPPMTGFGLFALGAVLGGMLSVVLGGVGIFLTRADPAGRGAALQALAVGLILVAAVLFSSAGSRDVPRINDITNNLDDPPAFVAAAREAANAGRDLSYPADWKPLVRTGYPDLAPIAVATGRDDTFQRALAAAEALGWEVVAQDPAAGTFEAQDVTAIFRFVDDVVVRVRGTGTGSLVDVRSKSRDGQGDLGANAARIRAFAAELSGAGATSDR